MDEKVITDIQISKIVTNSRDPIVVETKTTTTTTTTTVTKRIRITNNANIDIQSLMDIAEKTDAIESGVPSNQNDTTNKRAVPKTGKLLEDISASHHNDKNNQTLLSSTKIDSRVEFDESEELKSKRSISPNLSEITTEKYFHKTNKSDNTEMEKESKLKKNDNNLSKKDTINKEKDENPKKNYVKSKGKTKVMNKIEKVVENDGNIVEQRSTRSKSNNGSKSSIAYINDLIDVYMTIERKPCIEDDKVLPSLIEQKDLSPIFEKSHEIVQSQPQTPHRPKTVSPIDFGEINNDDVNYFEPSDQSNTPAEPKVKGKHAKSKRDGISAKKTENIKKIERKSKIIETKESAKSSSQQSKIRDENKSPIKIYSPSARGKFRTGTDNRLVLTRKMIAKNLQKHPDASKSMLDRMRDSNEITVEANSRLIYYPGNDEKSMEKPKFTKGIDILSVLKMKNKPILVKEIYNE